MADDVLSYPPIGFAAQRRWLADVHRRYTHRSFVQHDPLHFLYKYDDPADREIVGLIAALLAYGNVKAIAGGIANALSRMGPTPHRYLLDGSPARIRQDFHDFRYRVTSGWQMANLLTGVRSMVMMHGSLHQGFARHMRPAHANVLDATRAWIDELADGANRASGQEEGRGMFDHLLPHPRRGSACKRVMLYLRWMVRHDEVDIGSWSSVSPVLLIAPVDTHLLAMARRMRWTKRKQANMATALEITEVLRRFDGNDPLRYDFALTRPGILRVPMRRGNE